MADPIQPAHPAPDGSGNWTTLSDADYYASQKANPPAPTIIDVGGPKTVAPAPGGNSGQGTGSVGGGGPAGAVPTAASMGIDLSIPAQASSAPASAPKPIQISPDDFVPATPTAQVAPEDFVATPKAADPKDLPKGPEAYNDLVKHYSQVYNVPADLAQATIAASNPTFDPSLKQKDGSTGLFQLPPGTASLLGVDPTDPQQDVEGGIRHLANYYNQFHGNEPMAILAAKFGPPSEWNTPAADQYVQNFYQAKGEPVPQSYEGLKNTLNSTPLWNTSMNLGNDIFAGGLAPAFAYAHAQLAPPNTTSYRQERDLQEAEEEQYRGENPGSALLSDVAGFALPNSLAGKAVTSGARALGEAYPAAKGVLGKLMGEQAAPAAGDGLSQLGAAPSVLQRAGTVVRSGVAGAGYGALDSGADPDTDALTQAMFGGFGGTAAGTVAQGVSPFLKYMGDAVGPRLSGDSADAWAKRGQTALGSITGDNPTLTQSTIPGVKYTLPEALGGRNLHLNALTKEVGDKTPALVERANQNNAARTSFFHNIVGGSDDLEAIKKQEREAARSLKPNYSDPALPDLDIKPAAKIVKDALASPDMQKDEFAKTMKQVHDLLYKKGTPGPAPKEEMTLDQLEAYYKSMEGPKFSPNSKDFHYPIKDAKGNEAGIIVGRQEPETASEHAHLRIINTALHSTTSQGKGLGSAAYEKLAKWGLEHDMPLHSDSYVSPDAARMYASLEKKGFQVWKNPTVDKLELQKSGGYSTNDGRPAFIVQKAPPEDFEKGLEESLKKDAEPAKQELHNRADWVEKTKDAISLMLNRKENGQLALQDHDLRGRLLDVKNALDDELSDKVEGHRLFQDTYAALRQRQNELEWLQKRNVVDKNGTVSSTALNSMINAADKAYLAPGVAGTRAQAKAVTPQTLSKLRQLLEDIQVSEAVGIPTKLSADVKEQSVPLVRRLMQGASGTAGIGVARAMGLPWWVGFPAGVATEESLARAYGANANAAKAGKLTAILHPEKYPPRVAPPAAQAPGLISGGVGSSVANSLGHGSGNGEEKKKPGFNIQRESTAPGQASQYGATPAGVPPWSIPGSEQYPYSRLFAQGSFPHNSSVNSPGLNAALAHGVAQPQPNELPNSDDDFIAQVDKLAKETNRKVSPARRQAIVDEFNAARRSPLARLGFNLGHTLAMPEGFTYGDEAGMYSPDKDFINTALESEPGNLTHEALHRGIAMLKAAGRYPHASEMKSEFDDDTANERYVRAIMHDTMGDPEAKRRPDSGGYLGYDDIYGADVAHRDAEEYVNNTEGSKFAKDPITGDSYNSRTGEKKIGDSWNMGSNGLNYQAQIEALNRAAAKYLLEMRAKGKRIDY